MGSTSLRICKLLLWICALSWSSCVFAEIFDARANLKDTGKSTGGNSSCITKTISFRFREDDDLLAINVGEGDFHAISQPAVTELLVELLQVNSTLIRRVVLGPQLTLGNYDIYASLCVPPADATGARKVVDTVQFLTHGDISSSRYWDIAPGYSYVDAMTAAGYAVFSYDRTGFGNSTHPDPVTDVQASFHVDVVHGLVQLLRRNQVGENTNFSKIVGVGHAARSVITQAVTRNYSKDFDAVILTGLSLNGASTDRSSFGRVGPSNRHPGRKKIC